MEKVLERHQMLIDGLLRWETSEVQSFELTSPPKKSHIIFIVTNLLQVQLTGQVRLEQLSFCKKNKRTQTFTLYHTQKLKYSQN